MLLDLYSNRFLLLLLYYFLYFLFIFYVLFINIPIGHISVIILMGVIKRV